eukprot:Gb_23057 [translate_table: standard]
MALEGARYFDVEPRHFLPSRLLLFEADATAMHQIFARIGLWFFSIGLLIFFIRNKLCNRPYYTGRPTVYPIVGILFDFIKNRNRFLEWITDILSQTPSNTFTLHRPGGFRAVMTANPANVEHILKTHFENYPKGRTFSFYFHHFLARGIFNVGGELWRMQRKTASHEFNTKSGSVGKHLG